MLQTLGRDPYLSYHYRAELTYVVHILSQFMHSLKEDHMEATRRVIHYLKGSVSEVIFLLPKTIFSYTVIVNRIGERVLFHEVP